MRKTIHLMKLSAIIWFFLLSVETTSATILIPMDLDQLVKGSKYIFYGVVVENQNRLAEDDLMVYTDTALKVKKIFKGDIVEGEEVTLSVQGGEFPDGRMLFILENPIPDIGDRGIFFISDETNDICPYTGMSQGVLKVKEDENGIYRVYDYHDKAILAIKYGGFVKEDPEQDQSRPKPILVSSSDDHPSIPLGQSINAGETARINALSIDDFSKNFFTFIKEKGHEDKK